MNRRVAADTEIQNALNCKKKIRQESKESGERVDKRLKEKHDKRYKNEVFHKDNIVLVW